MIKLEAIFRSHFSKYKDSRREIERKDAREISEDHSAMANLPEQFIHQEWQKNSPHAAPTRNDVVHNDDFGF